MCSSRKKMPLGDGNSLRFTLTFLLALGLDEYAERRLFHSARCLQWSGGFGLIFWLYPLYSASQHGAKDECESREFECRTGFELTGKGKS